MFRSNAADSNGHALGGCQPTIRLRVSLGTPELYRNMATD